MGVGLDGAQSLLTRVRRVTSLSVDAAAAGHLPRCRPFAVAAFPAFTPLFRRFISSVERGGYPGSCGGERARGKGTGPRGLASRGACLWASPIPHVVAIQLHVPSFVTGALGLRALGIGSTAHFHGRKSCCGTPNVRTPRTSAAGHCRRVSSIDGHPRADREGEGIRARDWIWAGEDHLRRLHGNVRLCECAFPVLFASRAPLSIASPRYIMGFPFFPLAAARKNGELFATVMDMGCGVVFANNKPLASSLDLFKRVRTLAGTRYSAHAAAVAHRCLSESPPWLREGGAPCSFGLPTAHVRPKARAAGVEHWSGDAVPRGAPLCLPVERNACRRPRSRVAAFPASLMSTVHTSRVLTSCDNGHGPRFPFRPTLPSWRAHSDDPPGSILGG